MTIFTWWLMWEWVVGMRMMATRHIWRWKLGLKGRPTVVEVVGSDDAGGHHQTHETSETHSFYIALTCVANTTVQCGPIFPYYFSLWWPLLTLGVCPHFLHHSCSMLTIKIIEITMKMQCNDDQWQRYFILVRTNSNVKISNAMTISGKDTLS